MLGEALGWARKGERVSVRLPNGKVRSLIARNDILSNPVLVVGDRALSQDGDQYLSTRTVDLYRSQPSIDEEVEPILVTLWQKNVKSGTPIPLVNPRWRREREQETIQLLAPAKYRITGDGDGEYLEPANTLMSLSIGSGLGVTRFERRFSRTTEENRASRDPSYEPRSGRDLVEELIAGAKTIIDYSTPPGVTAIGASETIADRDYVYQLRHALNIDWLSAVFGEGEAAQIVRRNLNHITLQGLDGFTSTVNGQFVTYQKVVRAGEAYPQIKVILDPISSPGGALTEAIEYQIEAQLDIFTPYQHWYSNGDKSEFWLNLSSDGFNPVKVLEVDKLEALRLFMTSLPDKVYLVAKVGKNYRPVANVSGGVEFAEPFETAHWMQIRVMEISLNGEVETRVYNYPDEPVVDLDNTQPWAYSYTDLNSNGHEWENDCHFQRSVATRREYAHQSEYVGSQFVDGIDREFEGQLVSYTFEETGRGYFFNPDRYNVVNPPAVFGDLA